MTERPADPDHLTHVEEAVDRLEEDVVGHRVDQRRDEEDDPRPAHRQDVESGTGAPDGPGAEPSG